MSTTFNPFAMPQSDPFFNNPIINMPAPRHNSQSSLSSTNSSNSYTPPTNDNQWDEDNNNKRSSKRGVSTFISKLFGMVSERRNQHLISWNPSGTSFLVCNATRFSQEILPEHFKHSNFSSFVRQLNMYGFHKINKSPRGQRGNNENEIWEFSHPKFQRGRPDILEDIKRKAMDSELLRRETGDIHASFAMVQLSQADLLQQFRVLQENFSNLLQGFEEMRKAQLQQQVIIKKLAERQGVPLNNSQLPDHPTVFVTSDSTPSHWEQPQQYSNNNSNMLMHPYSNNLFPPSPVHSVYLPYPRSSSCDETNSKY